MTGDGRIETRRRRGGPLLVVLALLAPGCAVEADPPEARRSELPPASERPAPGSSGPGVRVRYEVRTRDGGSMQARIEYRLPSGDVRRASVRIPWTGEPLAFEEGDVMSIRAETAKGAGSPLLCVLASEVTEQGSYVFSTQRDFLTRCETEYELGQWPPDDSDPTANPLIRVG